ncbi:MAG: hypothetical protein JWP66_844 [Naasia sp.]|nr:hypothetical protein [Naasia sp.]
MTSEHSESGHGDSPAAWTAVAVMLVGLSAATLGLYLDLSFDEDWGWLLWGGVIVTVLGAVLGFVLKKAGFGVDGPRTAKKQHS